MMSITAICDLYAFLYSSMPTPAGTWDSVIPVDGAYAAIKCVDGIDYLMFRGSITLKDWWDDFDDFALPAQDMMLGPVHPGAYAGVKSIKLQLDSLLPDGKRVVIVGHSLGAMHAAIYAGMRVTEKLSMDGLVMFGEPRSGGPQLSGILNGSGIEIHSFRNANADGHDYVTDVARSLPPEFPYQHARDPLVDINSGPSANDYLPLRYHHFSRYAKYFGCAAPQVLALPD